MPNTQEVIRAIENARQQLSDISKDAKAYSDVGPAYERIDRWKERTVRLLNEQVSVTEGGKLDGVRPFSGGDELTLLRNHIKRYDAALLGVIETLNYFPTHKIETSGVRENSQDIFISYSSLDQKEAGILHNAITDAGKRAFLSVKSLNPGENFADEIRNHTNKIARTVASGQPK